MGYDNSTVITLSAFIKRKGDIVLIYIAVFILQTNTNL